MSFQMVAYLGKLHIILSLDTQTLTMLSRSVEYHCNLNIKPGILNPLNTIMEYQRFASTIAFNESRPPTTTLSPNAKIVTYKDKTMHLDNWINGMRQAFNDATALVTQLFQKKDFCIKMPDNLVDNMTNSTYGYSMLNQLVSENPHVLMQHLITNSSNTPPCKLANDKTLIWDTAWQLKWMQTAGALNQVLASLHHTVPGQPSRIAELCDFRIRNGLRGRNIFHDHGAIWFIGRRFKSENLLGHEEFIPVKLPPELAHLFLLYLVIIRPVEVNFARRLWGQDAAELYNEYLYITNGRRLEEHMFYPLFKDFTLHYFQCCIGVRGYRQMVVVIARAYLGTEYELEVEEDEDALIKQRGHGSIADRRCYGVQSRYLSTLSSDVMFRFGHISQWWWQLTQFAPGKAPLLPLDIRRMTSGDGGYYLPISSQNDTLPSVQSANSGFNPAVIDDGVVAAKVAASLSTVIHAMKNEIQAMVQTSVAAGIAEFMARQTPSDHLLLQQQSPTPSVTFPAKEKLQEIMDTSETPVSTPDPIAVEVLESPVHTPTSEQQSSNCLEYLAKLYPQHTPAKFRSASQQRMVNMAFNAAQSFIGILPTGGGKSLIFLLPAFAEALEAGLTNDPSKTLVVIPNKSLLNDTLRKAHEFKIPCAQWTVQTDKETIRHCSLILLAIETVASCKFRQYVSLFFCDMDYN